MKHISEIITRRKPTRKKRDITQGWTAQDGTYTKKGINARIHESNTTSGLYVAHAVFGSQYFSGYGFKSLEQAIGWILAKGRAEDEL